MLPHSRASMRLLLVVASLVVIAIQTNDEEKEEYEYIFDLRSVRELMKDRYMTVRSRKSPWEDNVCREINFTTDVTKLKHGNDDQVKTQTQVIFIGILGFQGKGKTWLLNTLFGNLQIPDGKHHKTKGISTKIVYTNRVIQHFRLGKKTAEPSYCKHAFVVLDTAGLQQSVGFKMDEEDLSDEENAAAKQKIKEKEDEEKRKSRIEEGRLFERVMISLVAKLSDVVFFVVNDYTWVEQKMVYDLMDILQMLENGNEEAGRNLADGRKRKLFIINNKLGTTKQEAEQKFKDGISSMYIGRVFVPVTEDLDENKLYQQIVLQPEKSDRFNVNHWGFMTDDKVPRDEVTNKAHKKQKNAIINEMLNVPWREFSNLKNYFEENLKEVLSKYVRCVEIQESKNKEKQGNLQIMKLKDEDVFSISFSQSKVQARKHHGKATVKLHIKHEDKYRCELDYKADGTRRSQFEPPPPRRYALEEDVLADAEARVKKSIVQFEFPGVKSSGIVYRKTENNRIQVEAIRENLIPFGAYFDGSTKESTEGKYSHELPRGFGGLDCYFAYPGKTEGKKELTEKDCEDYINFKNGVLTLSCDGDIQM